MGFLADLRIDPGRRESDVDEDTDDLSGGGEDRIVLRLLDLLEEALTEQIRPEIATKLRRLRAASEVARVPTYLNGKFDESRMLLPRSVVRSLEEQILDMLINLNAHEGERVATIAGLPSGWLSSTRG